MRRSVIPAAARSGTASIVRSRSSDPSSRFTSRRLPVTCRPSGSRPAAVSRSRISAMPATGSAAAAPQGIQPDPNRARRRTTRGLMVPLTHTGTPPGCRGFGIMCVASNCSSGESYAARCSRQRVWHTSSEWSSRRPRWSKSRPAASYSSRCQPTPTPRSRRPPESTSRVDVILARTAGRRNAATRMLVPRRTRDVIPASTDNVVSGSSQWPSGPVGCLPPACPPISGRLYSSSRSPNTTWSDTTRRSTPASSATRAASNRGCQVPGSSAAYDVTPMDS